MKNKKYIKMLKTFCNIYGKQYIEVVKRFQFDQACFRGAEAITNSGGKVR